MNEKTSKAKKIALKILPWVFVVIVAIVFAVWKWLDTRQAQQHVHATLVQVLYDTTDMRTGDLVFRNGLGNESLLVTTTSNGDYSHIGMAYHTNKGWYVIHAVPGENEKDQPEYIKLEPISEFYNPERACAGGTARVDCSDEVAQAAVRHALYKKDKGVIFDNDYDMDDTTELYCTELVRLCYINQGVDLVEDRYAPTPGFGESGRVMYPEHVWQSPLAIKKRIFKFKEIINE